MSDFSVFVPVGEQAAGSTVYVGQLTVVDDCGIIVNGVSESVHANNYLIIGGHVLTGSELGATSYWELDLDPGVYDVQYFVGDRSVGEQPAGASYDFTVTENVCQIETTTTTVPETATTTNVVTTTTVPVTTSSTDGSTTTSSSLVITSTSSIPPVTVPDETLPMTGLEDPVTAALLGFGLLIGGIATLISRIRIDNA